MSAPSGRMVSVADQLHAGATELLDGLIEAAARDMDRNDAKDDNPGDAVDIAEMSVYIRDAAQRRPDGGISTLSVALALAIHRLARAARP